MRLLFTTLLLVSGWCLTKQDAVDSSEFGTGGGKAQPDCNCGRRNNKNSRIVGGEFTGVNEFPWIAGILELGDKGPGCGGVILSPRIVLTAAHCTEEMHNSKIQVLIGAHNIFKPEETKTQLINVKKFVEHPDYDKLGNMENDIALLYLEKDIQTSSKVGPICFPTEKIDYVNQKLTVMGWGRIGTDKSHSPILRKVELDGKPLGLCVKAYGNGINQKKGQVSQFCTYTPQKDSCQADSGGPVVWRDPAMNLYISAGIISYGGDECGEAPGINTNTFFYRDWILQTMKKLDSSQKVCQKK